MIQNRSLGIVLGIIVTLQWLGLSPRSHDFTSPRIASISLTVLVIIPLTVNFYKSAFFVSVLCSGLASLFYIGRNIFCYKEFRNLLETYHKMNTPLNDVKYKFSKTLLFLIIDVTVKSSVCYFQGVVMADILLLIHIFKTIETRILVYILRCQSELLKRGELQDYRLICRGLVGLRAYLAKQLLVSCFLCFIWSSNTTFVGITSFSKILLTQDGSVLECSCYWASLFVAIFNKVALISSYSCIEEQKIKFEDRLYWRLISSTQEMNLISPKHIMLFEICSKDKEETTLKIDYNLIYTIITSVGTFLVLLVQFELEDIICGREKEDM